MVRIAVIVYIPGFALLRDERMTSNFPSRIFLTVVFSVISLPSGAVILNAIDSCEDLQPFDWIVLLDWPVPLKLASFALFLTAASE